MTYPQSPEEYWMEECDKLKARLAEAERDAAMHYQARVDLLVLLRQCLDAWTGDGPPMVLDRIRKALGLVAADSAPVRRNAYGDELCGHTNASGQPIAKRGCALCSVE